MPAPKKRYYSTKDIQEILGISRSKSIQIMHMFDKHGQLFRQSNTMRVEIAIFEEWCAEHTDRQPSLA